MSRGVDIVRHIFRKIKCKKVKIEVTGPKKQKKKILKFPKFSINLNLKLKRKCVRCNPHFNKSRSTYLYLAF